MGEDEKTGIFRLGISDHLNWNENESGEHLRMLQEKINAYLAFIEGGQLYEDQPSAKGRNISIQVYGKYPLSGAAKEFYTKAQKIVSEAGFDLEFKLLEEGLDYAL